MSSRFRSHLRSKWGLHTLGLRLVLGYAALFVASVLILAVLAYVTFSHFMREPDRTLMRTQSYELATAYHRGGIDALRREIVATPVLERREELLVRFVDASGQVRLVFNPDNWRPDEIELLNGLSPQGREGWVNLGPAADEDVLEAFLLRLDDGSILQVGIDTDLRGDAVSSIRSAFLAIALPVLILALLVGALMAHRALRPVRQLVQSFQTVTETGDLETRVDAAGTRGEFDELVRLFNRMVERIQQVVTGMRRTLDAIAHDLRTPMTRLQMRAEMALHEGGSVDAYREALSQNIEESTAVLATLEAMMEVAEAESGVMPMNLQQVNLETIIQDVADLYEIVAEDKKVRLWTDVQPAIVVQADRNRLRQVVANLVDNAIKYTPSGGEVGISATASDSQVRIVVSDTGPGIPDQDRPRIWDRLYRGDESRSERGLGLGLSLVKAIVEAHGGRVDVDSPPASGARFIVALPTTPPGIVAPTRMQSSFGSQ